MNKHYPAPPMVFDDGSVEKGDPGVRECTNHTLGARISRASHEDDTPSPDLNEGVLYREKMPYGFNH